MYVSFDATNFGKFSLKKNSAAKNEVTSTKHAVCYSIESQRERDYKDFQICTDLIIQWKNPFSSHQSQGERDKPFQLHKRLKAA